MAKLKIRPVGDHLLVQHVDDKEEVRGGVILPDRAKEKPQEAKVVALGTGSSGIGRLGGACAGRGKGLLIAKDSAVACCAHPRNGVPRGSVATPAE